MSQGYFSSWLANVSQLPFGLGVAPTGSAQLLLVRGANLTRASLKADIIRAELKQQDGYTRQSWALVDPLTYDATQRLVTPRKIWQRTALGGNWEWDGIVMLAGGHPQANVLLDGVGSGGFTKASHGLTVGAEVMLAGEDEGRLPTDLVATQIYHVVAATANSFQVAATPDGQPLALADGQLPIRLRYADGLIVAGLQQTPRFVGDGVMNEFQFSLTTTSAPSTTQGTAW